MQFEIINRSCQICIFTPQVSISCRFVIVSLIFEQFEVANLNTLMLYLLTTSIFILAYIVFMVIIPFLYCLLCKRDKLLKDIVITVLQYKRFLSKDIKVEICGIFQNILQKIARLRLKYVQNSFNARIFCNFDLSIKVDF